MQNHRFTLGPRESQLGTISWYISFGDLLTLMVCFFLLLTPRFAAQRQQGQTEQGVTKVQESAQILGTALAPIVTDVKGVSAGVVPVWYQDILGDSADKTAIGGRRNWLGMLVEQSSKGAIATVQICAGESEVEALSEVVEALRGVGESAGQVMFQLEAQCEVWRKQFASSQNLVGVVQFSRN